MNEYAAVAALRRRGRILGIGAGTTGLCAAAGAALNLGGWLQWAPTWPALACLALLTAALLAERARRPRWVIALVLPVIVLGSMVLVTGLSSGRGAVAALPRSLALLPVNTAAGLLAVALALALGARTPRGSASAMALVICAALGVALGTFGLLGRLFGIAPGIGWGAVSSVSLLTGGALVVCGSTLLWLHVPEQGGDGAVRGGQFPALFVLATALGATALAWRASAEAAASAQRERFDHQAQQFAAALQRRLEGYFDLLRGAQGLFAASNDVDADEWRRYWEQIDPAVHYPGIAGTGFAAQVSARQRGDFEGELAARIGPGLRIWPDGEREVYYPVTLLQSPRGANPWLAGWDLGSEPQRRDALLRAIADDGIALSGALDVAGAEAGEVAPGFAIYLPLRRGRQHEGGSPGGVLGVAYFELRARDALQPVGADWRGDLATQVFDGVQQYAAALLYADGEAAVGGPEQVRHLDMGGRRWTLHLRATPAFVAANRSAAPLSVLLIGLSCSLLLFAVVWLLAGRRAGAERLVARRTAELLRSQRGLQALTDTANDAIIAADSGGLIRYLNPAAERCFGYAARELQAQPLTLLMPERFRAAHSTGMARFLDGGEPRVIGHTTELAGLRSDGSEFPLEISIAHWLADGEHQFTAILRDISRRHAAERMLEQQRRELERSNADLEQFAYVASHDLQEPLRMVASYVQLLARRYRGKLDADADDFIGFAVDGALRMQRLIDDLLVYSRVATRSDAPCEVAVADCLQAALRNLAARIRDSAAEIRIGDLPTLRLDPLQLTQLLQNLIGNALKFCGAAPPRIEVDAVREDEYWHFRVRDHGIGLDPQYAERIFVIFQRLHTRQQYAGTGIGLAICKKIVERAGGRIWVESQPGHGATFHFTLPVVEQHA